MRNLIETEFDKTYNELNECYLTEIRSEHNALKSVDDTFNKREASLNDITMQLPEAVKLVYVDIINKLIREKGRLLDYLDNSFGKHVHHINLKSLGGAVNNLNNFIIVSPEDHLMLHKSLSDALNTYLEKYPEEELLYHITKNEVSKATTVLAHNIKTDLDHEQFITDFYNAAKAQSLRKLVAKDTYSDHANISKSFITDDAVPVVLVNIKVIGKEIFPDYNKPEILSVRQAAEYLKPNRDARKDIRTIRSKNAKWISRNKAPFNSLTDPYGDAWLILSIDDFNTIKEG